MYRPRFRFTLLLLTLCPLMAWAQEPFFCTRGERTLYYERYIAGTDSVLQNTTLEIGAIDSSDAGRKVPYGYIKRKPDGRAMLGGRTELVARILPDGDVMVDLYRSVHHFFRKLAPHVTVTAMSDPGYFPSQMQPGDTLPDSHGVIMISFLKYQMSYTDRHVLRHEKLTTPAGTYDCIVIREHRKERSILNKMDLWMDSWYARGVGCVRQDYYDRRMRLEETELLIRDEKTPSAAALLAEPADQVGRN